jgi:hypothetical protein
MNSIDNLNAIRTVAGALSDLNIRLAYIGGAVVSLYCNEPAAEDESKTNDAAITLELASLTELEKIRELFIKRGFTLLTADRVRCIFHYEGIIVDVLSYEDLGWTPGNPWFKKGFVYLEQKRIDEIKIIILPLSYFLATKFSAFHNRGRNDPATSNDFADIAYIIDNRTDLVEEILNSPENVQEYLKGEFNAIIHDKLMKKAILEKLNYKPQTKRFKLIIDKLKKITGAS